MKQIEIADYLTYYRKRRFSSVLLTMIVGLGLLSCSDHTIPVPVIDSESTPRLNIRITNLFQDEALNPISGSYTRATEDLIQHVAIYVFRGEEPVKLRNVDYADGIASATLPPLSGRLSAFVVANEVIEAPASRQDLRKRMARTEIGRNGIPPTGMPMGSSETIFQINQEGQTNVSLRLERCHSAIYIETPGGRNDNYWIHLRGEQQEQGALIRETQLLAPATSNSTNWTLGYPLSNRSTKEPVAYYYPTDGDIEINVQPRNTSLPPQRIVLEKSKAMLRNRKYILRIVPGATDGNTKREILPLITLVEEN